MTLLKSLINNVGDILGTSKLSKLNRTVFRPVLGTGISRTEYEMCNGAELMTVPSRREAAAIRHYKDDNRQQMANYLLKEMVNNGTVFRDERIALLALSQQTVPGVTNLCYQVRSQMSESGKQALEHTFRTQQHTAQFPQLRWR